jgi:DNA-binding CsgD family transcriptional regulator
VHNIFVTLYNSRRQTVWTSGQLPGVRETDYLGHDIGHTMTPEYAQVARAAFDQALATGRATYFCRAELAGQSVPFDCVIHRVEIGLTVFVLALARVAPEPLPEPLTATELLVARLLATDHTPHQIAQQIGCTRSTVASHCHSARTKLGCQTNEGLVAKILRAGTLD